MKQRNVTYQQKLWIKDAYLSICESPEAYGYETLEGHIEDVVEVIKEDVDQVFNWSVNNELIKQIIDNI